jgi:amino acid adenylation domain-containing protein
VELMGAAERTRVTQAWNGGREAHGGARCVHDVIEEQVRRGPHRVAVVCGDQELSYQALSQRSNQFAHWLRRLGVGPEVTVGVCLKRTTDLVIALLGILKAGGAYVPLEASNPPERLHWMAADAGVKLVVSDAERAAVWRGAGVRVLILESLRETLAEASAEDVGGAVSPDNLAYVLYTSGSTGRPKGVLVPHGGVTNYLRWCQKAYGMAAGGGVPVHSPLGFDLTVTSLLGGLAAGQRIVLVAEEQGWRGLSNLLRRERDHSLVKLTPAHLDLLRQELRPEEAEGRVRTMVIGGEALLAERLSFWRRHAPSTRLINEYGPTEAVVGCCVYEVRGEDASGGAVPIGRPIDNARMYVLDGQQRLAPVGVAGELYIGGAGLARGYLNDPGQTAARFVPDPFGDEIGGRLYRTGDIGRWRADGQLEFLGRGDEQVKLRGHRVELGEIEAVLGQHPAVLRAAVTARADMDGERRLVAYVVVRQPNAASPAELREYLARRLPEYMLPAAWVVLDQLPLTPNGKLDRGALPDPDAAERATNAVHVAPRTEVERTLARIWSEVLGTTDIGIHDNFFSLGGHSLMAARVIAASRDSLRIDLPLRDLFEFPTLYGLAKRVEACQRDSGAADSLPLVVTSSRDPAPLSYPQRRLWFLEQWEPGTAAYNISAAIGLSGQLDVAALRRGLAGIVRRHAALRTTFVSGRGEPAQVVAEEVPIALPLDDLRAFAREQRAAEAERLAREEARRPFDLARGPLLRARLARLSELEHLLVLTLHHIVCDAWSMAIFGAELAALYTGELEGRAVVLPPLPLQYPDYARWQRRWLEGARLERHLDYWRRRLRGAPGLLALPTDRPRPATQGFQGATHPVTLPAGLAAGLKRLARAERATLFMVLLAGFQALLHHLTGQDDLVVGTDAAGRERSEFEPLIGFFVNQLVLRTDLSGDPTFRELIGRARDVALGAYAHQELPFDLLVQHLRPQRDPGYSPLFQVKFFLVQDNVEPVFPGLTIESREIDTGGARHDLTLGLWETPRGIRGWINYRTALFDAETIQRFDDELIAILARSVNTPDLPLSRIIRSAEQRPEAAVPRRRFERVRPRMVSLYDNDAVRSSPLGPGGKLPLLVEPAAELSFAEWIVANRGWIEGKLAIHGAILFRGFGVNSTAPFERAASAICPDLLSENAEHVPISASGKVQVPVYYAPYRKLLWHNENSFNRSWPMKIIFGCARPAAQGGETPLVDCRRMFQRLPDPIRRQFLEKQITYVRTLGTGLGLDWRTLFRTEDKSRVEDACRRDAISFEWLDDQLQTRAVRPACLRHPASGEMVWFAQPHHWHVSCLDQETRESLLSMFGPGRLPRRCLFGDGTEIPDEVIREIGRTYQQLETSFPWQKGDLLLLDNMLTAHARNPYLGNREILVAMGSMVSV